ncbi:MAG: hypothetical protein HFI31_11225 [Lachnospiraceae bacterium]|nr:hypothetical protein [Lachnospiraceae bacterium]
MAENKECVDVSEYESGRENLAQLLKFKPNFDGSEMTEEQKRAALNQLINFVIMF